MLIICKLIFVFATSDYMDLSIVPPTIHTHTNKVEQNDSQIALVVKK